MPVATEGSSRQQSVRFAWRFRVRIADRLGAFMKRQEWEMALYEVTIYICTVVTAVWIVWGVR
jgi:hypothetical protein